jgi:hypothetical protein
MPVFRRSSAGASGGTADGSEATQSPTAPAKDKPPAQASKGRPTPKRREAERTRYRSITGGTSGGGTSGGRGQAPRTPQDKSAARAERVRRMEAMKRGEDWALGPRDKGQARKLARDYIDAHRRPSEYYMYVLVVLLIALLSRNAALNTYVTPLVLVLVVVIIIDAYFVRRALRGLVTERLPGESTRGLTLYAVMRALQIRRFRMPAPRLKPGDKF